jgi:prophage tail gpP-like protein
MHEATPVANAVAGMPLEVKIGRMILAGVVDETSAMIPGTSSTISTSAISS